MGMSLVFGPSRLTAESECFTGQRIRAYDQIRSFLKTFRSTTLARTFYPSAFHNLTSGHHHHRIHPLECMHLIKPTHCCCILFFHPIELWPLRPTRLLALKMAQSLDTSRNEAKGMSLVSVPLT
ncbi:hypothetical protein K443DRAFT_555002 [Laccaria amethystina LaAM-08-1]|uniref:Uncharacterized protein n=1 Tax=Laccaria amethystina LaAM-08-1 TaxID=1095629 RepID=A0A0C9X9E3_9AGAR|nr:hypothetical protein K443DRAFT_555002 [Laccaria amethystina LaAM-08-1]